MPVLYSADMIEAIGIDIGGTFVDIVLAGGGEARLVKLPSTPGAPHNAVLDGLRRLAEGGGLDPAGVQTIAHGSTVATNALLEGRWARTALVTTAGFRDVLEIGRQDRSSLYDLSIERRAPIVSRDLRFEVRERVGADGRVVTPLDPAEVERLVPRLRDAGVEAVAVVFLFSYLHPAHERLAGGILAAGLDVPVTLSSDVLPEFREFERTSTTAICAALRPVIGRYLGQLECGAQRIGFRPEWRIMQSSGMVIDSRSAEDEPVRILLSGPAAGVKGAQAVGELVGERGLIAMDMGGTSCDVSLIRGGEVLRTTSGAVGGYPVAQEMIGIHTIGAGGGSLAWIDSGGALRVGPRSAGAAPGPACYGRGGDRPTVTDAHLVLGHLVADRPLGGLPCLDEGAARAALRPIAKRLGLSIERAAEGVLEIADAAMERAIRVISVERGHDPRECALLAFGGAGPLHAVSIARRLAIPRVLVPATAGVLSALGLLTSEIGSDASRSVVRPLATLSVEALRRVAEGLRWQAEAVLRRQGLSAADMSFAASTDLRYVGQSHELSVPFPEGDDGTLLEGLATAFHCAHARRFGHAEPNEPVELVTVRVRAVGPPSLDGLPRLQMEAPLPEARVKASFPGCGAVATRVVSRAALQEGDAIEGPAVVIGEDATLIVPPGVGGSCGRLGTIVLEVE